ncbi:MAG: PilZ domain-containing protein [Thiogranum sp.]|nr:PilZ domain-containing protein [Thiogranum sp.]
MRSYIRHPSDIPIEYQVDTSDTGVSREHLNDISTGGLSFNADHKLDIGTMITIRITSVEPCAEVKGQVAWCRSEGSSFVIGVAFLDEDDLFRLRMVEQICHIEHYKAQVLATEGRRLSSEQAAREWIRKFAGKFPHLAEGGETC